jgi:hypothetical protein
MKGIGNRKHARDRRHIAIHEAGHFVMARWAGVRCTGAWMSPSYSIDGGGSFVGLTGFHHDQMQRLSHYRRMMIGVAGAMAEVIWNDQNGFAQEEHLGISGNDWATIGDDPERPSAKVHRACIAAGRLFEGEQWEPLIKAARVLMMEGLVLSDALRPRERAAWAEVMEDSRRSVMRLLDDAGGCKPPPEMMADVSRMQLVERNGVSVLVGV